MSRDRDNEKPSAPEDSPLRDVDLPQTDALLREDVRRLGALVGEILAEQAGQTFLDEVERVRIAAIRRREAAASVAELAELLGDREVGETELLVRAFLSYFQVVNLAERVHRIRRRRDYQRAGKAPQPGGFDDVLARLAASGVAADDLEACLGRLRIEPVFTAHPTEAVRRALLEKEQVVVRALVDDIDRGQTPQERAAGLGRIRQALTTAWQTAESPPEKPSVMDEFEHVSFYLADVLYPVVPVFFEDFEAALARSGLAAGPLPTQRMLAFGSWVGADMDGNPNVGASTIREALAAQRRLVLQAYLGDVERLGQLLTQSDARVSFAPELLDRIDAYRTLLPEVESRPRHADMPYRNFLALVAGRLHRTLEGIEGGYARREDFAADIALVDDSLCQHEGRRAGHFSVRRLRRRIAVFGFHLATLDLRQDSAVHDATLAALLEDPGWRKRAAIDRRRVLAEILGRHRPGVPVELPGEPDEPAGRVLAVFHAIAESLPESGVDAFGPYIISMTRSTADILAVLVLARTTGLVDGSGEVPLDVAPLFETVNDLEAAEGILRELLAEPVYRRHLEARGNRQIVMLGYSDSAKDAGIAAARWALQQTQVALTALAAEAGVRILFFHGRGGSLSRGGGKTERAVIAAPRGSVDGYLRVTEQGEVIHRKYGIRALALRNLEQAAGAVLQATLRPRPNEPRAGRWREIMRTIAGVSRDRYLELVTDADFVGYFRAATPIDVIERLRIGSRPSRRGTAAGGIDDLRAIPWVFAWSQNRAGLTAWYGVGSGLEAAAERFGADALATMVSDWPFFRSLVDDVEMVLAKSDMEIFRHYSELAGDAHAGFHPRIVAEFQRTTSRVLQLRDADELLAGDHRLRTSIRLRNPYVDPMSLLQVDLLRRWREAGRPEEGALFHALVSTVNGIAAGVQNTG